MSNKLYELTHSYEVGKYLMCDEVKMLGIYETYEDAEAKIDEYMELPGYKELGRDKFEINTINKKWIDNQIWWYDGFDFVILPWYICIKRRIKILINKLLKRQT